MTPTPEHLCRESSRPRISMGFRNWLRHPITLIGAVDACQRDTASRRPHEATCRGLMMRDHCMRLCWEFPTRRHFRDGYPTFAIAIYDEMLCLLLRREWDTRKVSTHDF